MLVKANGIWKQGLPLVKSGGVWKECKDSYIKRNGIYVPTKPPFSTDGHTVTLATFDYNGGIRHSFIRNGTGTSIGAVQRGAMNKLSVTIGGQSFYFRGVETGPDVNNWRGLSLQIFGEVPVDKMRKILYLNGVPAFYVSHAQHPTVLGTFINFLFAEPYVPPVGVPLELKF